MSSRNFPSKFFLASALITTGLLGSVPIMGDEIVLAEGSSISQKKISPRIEAQLCNQQFQCSKTGLIVHFLPNLKALVLHPTSSNTLNADYTVQFNRSIVINVYENPSKHFDVMMHDIAIRPEGFMASVNRENRYFQRI